MIHGTPEVAEQPQRGPVAATHDTSQSDACPSISFDVRDGSHITNVKWELDASVSDTVPGINVPWCASMMEAK